ncbi:MAG: protein kinase [Byssovorax sp.]
MGEANTSSARFSILRRLGEGGMGVVHLAHDAERNREVALKTLTTASASEIYRFKQEFRSLAGVVHKNLVQLHELVAEDNAWFFTMEYIAGVDFQRYVRQDLDAPIADRSTAVFASHETLMAATEAPMQLSARLDGLELALPPAERTAELRPASFDEIRLRGAVEQLVNGLRALHAAGKLHLDIKPSNVLVTDDGRVVILDFGLVTDVEPSRAAGEARLGPVLGTAAYMAPEQILGDPLSEAADWYGVGALLYEVLTGQLPFAGSVPEILRAKLEREAPGPGTLTLGLPDDLASLCVDLLRRDPAQRPSGREVLRRLGKMETGPQQLRRTRSRLVGRERHLAVLDEAFAETRQGRGVTVFLQGASGMGKSALVQLFLDRVAQLDDALVLSGRCYERESVPYKAFDSLVDALATHLTALPSDRVAALIPEHVVALARLFPVLGRIEAIAAELSSVAASPDPQELRRRGFLALRELLGRLAAERPLVIHLDDLHWGDLDSAALLMDLLRPPEPPGLLLLASYRREHEAQSPFLRAVLAERARPGAAGASRDLAVGPLEPAEARALAIDLLGGESPEAAAKAEIIARESAGHPYFVSELAQFMPPSREADAALGLGKAKITLDGMIHARVAQLPPEAQRLLEVVAVAGRPIATAVALRAAGLASDEYATLSLLQARRMVRTSGSRHDDEIETFHDRVRETVSAHIEPLPLADLHRRLGTALEASGAADPEELALHFQAAGELRRASDHAAKAAERAAQALAFDHAAGLYRLALQLREADAAFVRTLHRSLGDALANAGRGAEAARAYLDAVVGAPGPEQLELRRRAAEQLLISGHIDAGLDVMRAVLSSVGLELARSPERAVASMLYQRVQIRLRGLEFEERPADQISDEVLSKIDICWSVAVGLSVVDNIRAAEYGARQLLLALRAGEPSRVARSLTLENTFVASPGGSGTAQAEELARLAATLAKKLGKPHTTALSIMMAGVAKYLIGEWRAAARGCETADEILRDQCTGVAWETTTAQRFALSSRLYLGELGSLSRRVEVLLRSAEDRGNLYAATDLRTRFNLVWLAADDAERARAEVEDAMKRWSQRGFHLQHYSALQAMEQRDLYVGDAASASRRLDEQWPALKRSLLTRIQVLRVEVVHLRGRVALAMASRGADAKRHLAAAEGDAKQLEGERMAWAEPHGSLLRASIAAAKGDDRAAVRFTRTALRGYERADMALYAAAARRRLGQLLGGDEGRAFEKASAQWMTDQGVRRPEQLTAMLAPGPWKAIV